VQSQAFRDGYSVGQNLAVVFGALLVVVGLYYFFRKPKQG
jgi:LPXTG-motif cell wall-anchored protein